MPAKLFTSREGWLQKAVDLMKPLFQQHGYKIPAVKVSCGWPSVKGLSAKRRRIGECWSKSAATDGVCQIFVSPWLEKADGPEGVLSILVHEVVHAVVGVEEGHNKVFGKCARAVGLEGKLTATTAGEELCASIAKWAAALGGYPHAKLDLAKRPVKKQTTRMIKCVCPGCGFLVRLAQRWLDEVGVPHCPRHGAMAQDGKNENENENENE